MQGTRRISAGLASAPASISDALCGQVWSAWMTIRPSLALLAFHFIDSESACSLILHSRCSVTSYYPDGEIADHLPWSELAPLIVPSLTRRVGETRFLVCGVH